LFYFIFKVFYSSPFKSPLVQVHMSYFYWSIGFPLAQASFHPALGV